MNNPAGRLHAILQASKEKEIQRLNMIAGWRKVLSIPDTVDDLLTMNKIGKVFTLPHVITSLLQRFEDIDHDLYLGWKGDLLIAFRHVTFQSNFSEFGSRLSDSLLINIRFCDHELERRHPEKSITEEHLAALRDEANKLLDQILASELPPNLMRYLLDHAYLILEAIEDYPITGAPALERALDQAVGSVVTNRAVAQLAKDSTVGEQFWTFMGRIGLTLSIAKSAKEIGESVTKALLE